MTVSYSSLMLAWRMILPQRSFGPLLQSLAAAIAADARVACMHALQSAVLGDFPQFPQFPPPPSRGVFGLHPLGETAKLQTVSEELSAICCLTFGMHSESDTRSRSRHERNRTGDIEFGLTMHRAATPSKLIRT
jgi:hypothetical protein